MGSIAKVVLWSFVGRIHPGADVGRRHALPLPRLTAIEKRQRMALPDVPPACRGGGRNVILPDIATNRVLGARSGGEGMA